MNVDSLKHMSKYQIDTNHVEAAVELGSCKYVDFSDLDTDCVASTEIFLTKFSKRLREKSYSWTAGISPLALAACGGGGSSVNSSSVVPVTPSTPMTATIAASTTFPLTGNTFKDASLQGSKWIPENGILTYAVAHGFDNEFWDEINLVNDSLGLAMAEVAHFTNLKVQNLGNFSDPSAAADAGATIVLSLASGDTFSYYGYGNDTWAVGFFPDAEPLLYENMSGDMYLNIASEGANLPTGAYAPGGKGFMLLLHELGHALGLKHPFSDTGGRMTYEQAGYSQYQDQTYTVMAYEDQFGDVLNAPSTFMLGDVLSLMSLYGVNQSANSGNTTYTFYDSSLRETIWDAAGDDTLDLSAMNDPVKVYLTYLYSEADLGMEYGHIIVNPDATDAKWTHLLGEFESIYCGSGADKIFGDENNNFIHGGAGSDLIAGSGGNDILYGGEGNDTFILGFGDGQDIIRDFDFGNDQCIFWNGTEYDPTIASLSEDMNGYAAYILDDGTSISLEGVSYSQMAGVDTIIA